MTYSYNIFIDTSVQSLHLSADATLTKNQRITWSCNILKSKIQCQILWNILKIKWAPPIFRIKFKCSAELRLALTVAINEKGVRWSISRVVGDSFEEFPKLDVQSRHAQHLAIVEARPRHRHQHAWHMTHRVIYQTVMSPPSTCLIHDTQT